MSNQLRNLDILRGLAVLMVALHHFGTTVTIARGIDVHPYDWIIGKVGVLMFFVHTSLVLMMSLERLSDRKGPLFVPFYIRRIFRIYPLAIVAVVVVLLLRMPRDAWSQDIPAWSWKTITSNLLLIQNLVSENDISGPLWSLPIELQMYVVLPIIFTIITRYRSGTTVFVLWVFSLVSAIFLPLLDQRLGLASYAPCFLSGICAYRLRESVSPRLPSWVWCVHLLALAVFFVIYQSWQSEVHTMWIAWLFCASLGLTIPFFKDAIDNKLSRFAHYLAKYSFGIYLFNMVASWLVVTHLPTFSIVWQTIAYFAITATASIIGYHLIESPFIRMGNSLSDRFRRRSTRKDPQAAQV